MLDQRTHAAQGGAGPAVVLMATGTAGQNAVLLTSTTPTTPLSSWIPVATNTVGSSGHAFFTNGVNSSEAARYFAFGFH